MDKPVIIKKYANRRLYHTELKKYITLEELAQIIRDGREVKVVDNQTKEDITHETLMQIVFASQQQPQSLFSSDILHRLIRLQGERLQEFLRLYLGTSLDYFSQFKQNVAQQYNFWSQLWGVPPMEKPPEPPPERKPEADAIAQIQQKLAEYEAKIQDLEKQLKKERDEE